MPLFSRLIEFVGNARPEDAPAIATAGQQLGTQFLDCGKKGLRGFEEKHITPYLHYLTTHTAPMVADVGGLNAFSGERLERLNDEFKKDFMRQTNCRNVCDALRVQLRRQLAQRNKEIRTLERNANKAVKMTCQVNLIPKRLYKSMCWSVDLSVVFIYLFIYIFQ